MYTQPVEQVQCFEMIERDGQRFIHVLDPPRVMIIPSMRAFDMVIDDERCQRCGVWANPESVLDNDRIVARFGRYPSAVLLAVMLATAAHADTFEAVWGAVPNATGYRVEVRLAPTPWPSAGPDLGVTPTPGSGEYGARFNRVVAPGAVLEARVRALKGSTASQPSNIMVAAIATATRTRTVAGTATATVGVPAMKRFGRVP
jgi:acyl dehydratase